MELTLPYELVAAIGAAVGALIVAIVWLLIWMIRHLTGFAAALERGQVVNAALNDELLSVVKERDEERKMRDASYRDLLQGFEDERAGFRRELAQVRQEAELANKTLADELIKVKGTLVQYKSSLQALTMENARLEVRITELVEEGKIKDKKIAGMEQRLMLKVDKADTDDLTDSAAKVNPPDDDPPPTTPVSEPLEGGGQDNKPGQKAA